MRVVLTTLFVSLLVVVPSLSSAQTAAELQAQITALLQRISELRSQLGGGGNGPASSASAVSCPALTRALTIGSRGADVTALQEFLRARGHMQEEATGYFGPITEAAVQKMQAAHNVVSSGSAASTGYGAVGPKTRALISTLCGQSASAPAVTTPASQCAQATSPTVPNTACGGTWEKLYNLGCHIGWRCTAPTALGNKPPVITAIDGPTEMAVNTFGSWRIHAIDPEGSALAYQVTWGDEGFQDLLNAIAGLGGTFSANAAPTHAYGKEGAYTMRVTVQDAAGATAVAALGITVRATTTQSTVDTQTGTTPFNPFTTTPTTASSCVTPWGGQVVASGTTVNWQPFFTDGAYYATSTPIMKCLSGGWQKCDAAGANCQAYVHATSTPETAALPSYTTQIGSTCSPEGSTRKVQVPPGTQLCQWLTCRITTEVETLTLKCTHSGWTDYANY